MQESDSSIMRGVSIAAIVFSVLDILLCLLLLAAFLLFGIAASSSGALDWYVSNCDDLGMTHGLDSHYALDVQETFNVLSGVLIVLVGLGVILCVVSLLAGIMGVRHSRNPQKAGRVMGWSIAGAICAILMFRVVTCVLLVVSAVYASRLRHAAQNPSAYAQPTAACDSSQGQVPFN